MNERWREGVQIEPAGMVVGPTDRKTDQAGRRGFENRTNLSSLTFDSNVHCRAFGDGEDIAIDAPWADAQTFVGAWLNGSGSHVSLCASKHVIVVAFEWNTRKARQVADRVCRTSRWDRTIDARWGITFAGFDTRFTTVCGEAGQRAFAKTHVALRIPMARLPKRTMGINHALDTVRTSIGIGHAMQCGCLAQGSVVLAVIGLETPVCVSVTDPSEKGTDSIGPTTSTLTIDTRKWARTIVI